ncbi:ORF23 [Silurid herpesvirus 1]|nr:ORF23 [Silurid herpesvirus 1]
MEEDITFEILGNVFTVEWAILSINDITSLIQRPKVDFHEVDLSATDTFTVRVPEKISVAARLFIWGDGYGGVFIDDLREGSTYEWLRVISSKHGVRAPTDPPAIGLLDTYLDRDEIEMFTGMMDNIPISGGVDLWTTTVVHAFMPTSIEARIQAVWREVIRARGDPGALMGRMGVRLAHASGVDALIALAPVGDEEPEIICARCTEYLQGLSTLCVNGASATGVLRAPRPPSHINISQLAIGVLTNRPLNTCEIFVVIKDFDRWMFDRFTFKTQTCMLGNVLLNGLGVYERTLGELEARFTRREQESSSRKRRIQLLIQDDTEAEDPGRPLAKHPREPGEFRNDVFRIRQ